MQAPFEVWLAIPQYMATSRLDCPSPRVVRMSEGALADRVIKVAVNGVKVPVFSAAKTVADCFKFRNKIGLDVALETLRDGWVQRKFTMDDLGLHATQDRVANLIRPYVDAIAA